MAELCEMQEKEKNMKRALILTGKLVQDHEYIYPYYRVQEEGWHVDVATKNEETVLGYFGTKVVPNRNIQGLNVSDYDLLILPGGVKAMEHMRLEITILRFITDFHKAGKIIASICSAAQLLISANIVRGKRISGYYAMKDDIINAGATYVNAPAVVDSKIVTSPHYKYLGPWMQAVIREVR